MGLFNGTPKEQAIQLRFRDDGKFQFRKLDMVDTFLVERVQNQIIKGWKHFFRNQFPFAGYKKIPSGNVTLSYDRDIILDPYGLVDEREMPDYVPAGKNGSNGNGHKPDNTQRLKHGIIPWLVDVGHAQRLKIIAKRQKNSRGDMIVYFLGAALVIELLLIGLQIAIG